ncbi:hypothetical protein BC834DRAFT_885426 [Gloeopeniophorella convolvens]|nr:hypothetical protein BC834DRAFT_885426 [Gloeopeniophorella convolvens]
MVQTLPIVPTSHEYIFQSPSTAYSHQVMQSSRLHSVLWPPCLAYPGTQENTYDDLSVIVRLGSALFSGSTNVQAMAYSSHWDYYLREIAYRVRRYIPNNQPVDCEAVVVRRSKETFGPPYSQTSMSIQVEYNENLVSVNRSRVMQLRTKLIVMLTRSLRDTTLFWEFGASNQENEEGLGSTTIRPFYYNPRCGHELTFTSSSYHSPPSPTSRVSIAVRTLPYPS